MQPWEASADELLSGETLWVMLRAAWAGSCSSHILLLGRQTCAALQRLGGGDA